MNYHCKGGQFESILDDGNGNGKGNGEMGEEIRD
jgi:hypothetical protein